MAFRRQLSPVTRFAVKQSGLDQRGYAAWWRGWAAWRCGGVAVWRRGGVVVWRCGVARCGDVVVCAPL